MKKKTNNGRIRNLDFVMLRWKQVCRVDEVFFAGSIFQSICQRETWNEKAIMVVCRRDWGRRVKQYHSYKKKQDQQ